MTSGTRSERVQGHIYGARTLFLSLFMRTWTTFCCGDAGMLAEDA